MTGEHCSWVMRYHKNIGLGPWTKVRYGVDDHNSSPILKHQEFQFCNNGHHRIKNPLNAEQVSALKEITPN